MEKARSAGYPRFGIWGGSIPPPGNWRGRVVLGCAVYRPWCHAQDRYSLKIANATQTNANTHKGGQVGKPLSDQQRSEILAMIREGGSTNDIAARAGVSTSTIRKYRRAAGIYLKPTRAAPPSQEARADALRRYASGEPVEDIAAALGVALQTVYAWAALEGVSRRAVEPPRKFEALAMYRAGKPLREIAEKVGATPYYVRKWAESESVTRGGVKAPPVEAWRRVERLGEDETWIHTSGARVVITDRGKGAAPGRWRTLEPWIDQAFPTRAEALNGGLNDE